MLLRSLKYYIFAQHTSVFLLLDWARIVNGHTIHKQMDLGKDVNHVIEGRSNLKFGALSGCRVRRRACHQRYRGRYLLPSYVSSLVRRHPSSILKKA